MIKPGQMVPVAIMAQLTIICGSPIHQDQIIFKNLPFDIMQHFFNSYSQRITQLMMHSLN
jgi:hypothetical protein